MVKEWSDRLSQMMRVVDEPQVTVRGKHQFVSPLQPQFWEAWRKFSCDPEPSIAKWAREGVPLGMAAKIPSSNGVFPPVSDEAIEGGTDGPPELLLSYGEHESGSGRG